MSNHVTIFEVGPRDGLQNEKQLISTQDKVRLIDMLSECGFTRIEAASFVSPKWVPQMGDGEAVMAAIGRKPGVTYAALTPNMKGYDRAREAKVDEVAIFAAASETFSQKNINCSIDESIERFAPILDAAKRDGIAVRGYVSCVVDCPYEGKIAPSHTARVAKILIDAGCYQVSLGDTTGMGRPQTVLAMLDVVLKVVSADMLAGHFHDTNGMALDNIRVSLEKGLRVFDSAVGGLGGCPYAPGAKGNVATRSVVTMLENEGYRTGINLEALLRVEEFLNKLITPREISS
ncbi:MAG: hydroxymethylglutaryl-CoA lyase [Rhizobiaceae bacterium]|nr:hydroxymethylglutaryl-CoA lyase [Rhizobiaceae bacterium]